MNLTAIVENPTTLMLLTGISTAATRGVKWPVTAKLNAMALYPNDIAKADFNIRVDAFASDRNLSMFFS